jgi:hypothetical protein
MKKSYKPANTFVDSFDSYTLVLFAQFISFILGSFVVVLLVGAIYDDHFLLETQIGSRSALVLLGILGSLLAVVREFIPPDDKVIEPNKTMKEISKHTHYLPEHWISSQGILAHKPQVQAEFFALYRHKALIYLNEALGIILAPLVMIFFLPRNAELIIQFFRDYTVEIVDLPMCSFASFDPKLGNKNFFLTTPLIPDTIPEESLSQYTLKRPLFPLEPESEPEPDSEHPEFTRRLTKPDQLIGTQAIRGLLKDRGSHRSSDEVIIEINESQDYPRRTRPRPNDEDLISLQSSNLIPLVSGSVQSSKNGKMELSILNFKTNYPKWTLAQDIDQFITDMNSTLLLDHS